MPNPYAHAVKRLQERSIAISDLRMAVQHQQSGIDPLQVLLWLEQTNTDLAHVVNDLGKLEHRLFEAAKAFNPSVAAKTD